jgi:hypothetical protein
VYGWNVQRWLRWRVEPKRAPGRHPVRPADAPERRRRAGRRSGTQLLRLGARSFYAAQKHQLLFHSEKKEGFGEFLRKNDVGVVMLSPTLANDPLYASDPEFRQFVAEDGGEASRSWKCRVDSRALPSRRTCCLRD